MIIEPVSRVELRCFQRPPVTAHQRRTTQHVAGSGLREHERASG
jgi:hypothetical protein